MWASTNSKNTLTVKTLLEAGADVNHKDEVMSLCFSVEENHSGLSRRETMH